MRQVLFTIPLHEWIGQHVSWLSFVPNVPVYGYGMMLFFAFIFCNALARRLCRREGINSDLVLDLAIWLFVGGILGARVVFVIQYWPTFAVNSTALETLRKIVSLWDGGLVFYGSYLGGAMAYFAYHYIYLRHYQVSNWKMLDVIAPCLALGLALGRIGCLFTGCCYGNVACSDSPQIHFPLLTSPVQICAPTQEMLKRGYQTPFGFSLKENSLEVAAVEPGLAADLAGLRVGDFIVKVNGQGIAEQQALWGVVTPLQLTIFRQRERIDLPTFTPDSIGLNPTQIYESISMFLLLFFLLSYYPYRRHQGELMVLFMLAYGVHRFLNEWLRTDTEKVAFNLTLSQNVSIGVLIGGMVLAYFVWRRPPITQEGPTALPSTVEVPAKQVAQV